MTIPKPDLTTSPLHPLYSGWKKTSVKKCATTCAKLPACLSLSSMLRVPPHQDHGNYLHTSRAPNCNLTCKNHGALILWLKHELLCTWNELQKVTWWQVDLKETEMGRKKKMLMDANVEEGEIMKEQCCHIHTLNPCLQPSCWAFTFHINSTLLAWLESVVAI